MQNKVINEKTLQRVFKYKFSNIYYLYLTKIRNKNRTKDELDQIIKWLTGYSQQELENHIELETELKPFLMGASNFNPDSIKITGLICGYRIEDIKDETMRRVRYMDKIVDELAKGKPLEKIFR
ncbi:MAG: DUF2200 family protein [Patescibacteria group bacterium]